MHLKLDKFQVTYKKQGVIKMTPCLINNYNKGNYSVITLAFSGLL